MLKMDRRSRRIVEGRLTHHIPVCRILVQVESLKEIYKSSNNSDEDEDCIYFPAAQKLLAGQRASRGHAPNAIEKLALGDSNRSINRPIRGTVKV